MATRSPDRATAPSTRASTPSSRAICVIGSLTSLYRITEVREIGRQVSQRQDCQRVYPLGVVGSGRSLLEQPQSHGEQARHSQSGEEPATGLDATSEGRNLCLLRRIPAA